MLKKKKVSHGWNSTADLINRGYRDIFSEFERYMRAENDVIRGAEEDKKDKLKHGDKERWNSEKYYQKQLLNYARSIQKEYKSLKQALKKIDASTDFIELR